MQEMVAHLKIACGQHSIGKFMLVSEIIGNSLFKVRGKLIFAVVPAKYDSNKFGFFFGIFSLECVPSYKVAI